METQSESEMTMEVETLYNHTVFRQLQIIVKSLNLV
jgi:hypothetical protein